MRERDYLLDWVRGLSALAVLFAHVRGFAFVDFEESPTLGTIAKAFYLLTGLHHQAVMVFFVLSGYFVGGGVLSALSKGKFQWSKYISARLSRLWVVLIPALIFTLVCDSLGRFEAPGLYEGANREIWMSGPEVDTPADNGLVTFVGNIFFLQTVTTSVYGSNGPLWSLANEFWYYVLFPLFILGLSLSLIHI